MQKLIRMLLIMLACNLGFLFSPALAKRMTNNESMVWSTNHHSPVVEAANVHNPHWSPTKNHPFPLNINHLSVGICFSPGGECTRHIVDVIQHATHSVRVQAFSFTSKPIARALIEAHKRGVVVTVILDKSNVCEARERPPACKKKHRISHTQMTALMQAGIPVYIDYLMRIAHNKIMIIDDAITLTGSFNFTYSAERNNTENVIFIHNKEVTGAYLTDFNDRLNHSLTVNDYYCHFLRCCAIRVSRGKIALSGCS